MGCFTNAWVLAGLLSLSLHAEADAPASPSAPAVPDSSLPKAYRDFHVAPSIALTFLTPSNMHHEVNAIFTDNWEIPSTTASKTSGLVQLGDPALGRLARVTAYWPGEAGDPYTAMHLSSTGVHLHVGHCAVDPAVIPYGSVVQISGVGIFLAVDTGSAVVSRVAARGAGHTAMEKGAPVIDLFFESESDGKEFAAHGPTFASICWWAPDAKGEEAKLARSLVAGEEWTRIYGRQLVSSRL